MHLHQSGFNQFSIIFVKMNITEDNINKIKDLCLKHKVKELYLFGSALFRFKHSSLKLSLKDSMNGLSVGFPS